MDVIKDLPAGSKLNVQVKTDENGVQHIVEEGGEELLTLTPKPIPTVVTALMSGVFDVPDPVTRRSTPRGPSGSFTKKNKEESKKERKQSAKSRKINRGK
jgi:hypothetical protein